MFRHMLKKNPEAKHILDQYLDEIDLIFIEELIDPPKRFVTISMKRKLNLDRLQWKLVVKRSTEREILSLRHNIQ